MRSVVRGIGELLITLGLVMVLFVVYGLYWTGVETRRAQDALRDQLERRWGNQDGSQKGGDESYARGDAIGVMRIPRLGEDWSWVVLEGVAPAVLEDGPGHYPDTAMPGELGNFAVAGHRATNGEPFATLDGLRRADEIIMTTTDKVYTYRVERHEITEPTAVGAVLPVPYRPGRKPNARRITLTTCNPRWSSTQRLIYYGRLASVEQREPDGAASGR